VVMGFDMFYKLKQPRLCSTDAKRRDHLKNSNNFQCYILARGSSPLFSFASHRITQASFCSEPTN